MIEYGGIDKDPEYEAVLLRKQATYAANGLTAQVWTPGLFHGDWPTRRLDRIDTVLKFAKKRGRQVSPKKPS